MTRTAYNLAEWLNIWNGLPCLILGRGKSTFDIPLVDIDAFRERGGKVIILTELGNVKEYFERADMWAFLDRPTITACEEAMKNFGGILWTQESICRKTHPSKIGELSNALLVRDNHQFNPDGTTLNRASTAFFAAQLAWYAGCDPIWIAGVDLLVFNDGRTHGDKQEPQANYEHFQRMLLRQWPSFDNMALWIGIHAFNRHVYKTSSYSILPFETRSINE